MSENNKKNGKEQKKSFSIGRLFQSNRFVLLFSAFVAIVLWFIMAFNNTENRARVIYDIPIDVSLSDEMVDQDYRIFEQSETTARVSVTGSSLIVNQLSADDIKVSAALAANITRAGTYTLNLTASKNSTITDYTFDTTYPGSIILFVDKYEEKTFTVEPNLEFTVADGYYASSPTLADNKVTISGPETEISEIKQVVLEKKLDGALKEPTEFVQSYTFYDKDGKKITNLDHLTISTTETTVKIDVLKRADLPVVATYRNLPDGVDISSIVTVNPDTLKIGRDTQSADDEQKEISLEPVDMSEVNLRNTTFSVDFQLPSNYTNISGVKHAAVKFDLSGYSEETFVVDNFVVNNQADGQQVDLDTTQLEVTVVGPTAQLSKLKASDLYAEIDLSGKEDLVGSVALPAKIHISSKFGSWIYGTYTAYVNITRE